jgi:hypothetical protein
LSLVALRAHIGELRGLLPSTASKQHLSLSMQWLLVGRAVHAVTASESAGVGGVESTSMRYPVIFSRESADS